MSKSSRAPARVLIADDHELARAGLRSVLSGSRTLAVVGEAGGGHEAIERCRALAPDLVLLDVRMPDMNGLEAARVIRAAQPVVRVVLVTIEEDLDLQAVAQHAGASRVIAKGSPRQALLAEIYEVLRAPAPPVPSDVIPSQTHGLERALERGQVIPYYQPQVSARTGEMVGVEALVRWEHPTLGVLPPARFFPEAERTGLLGSVDRQVLECAVTQYQTWRNHGSDLRIAVNVSPVHLHDPNLPGRVIELMSRADIAPGRLEFEITEGQMLEDTARTRAVLHTLRGAGVRLSIDDFGVGYASLDYLRRLPVDQIKIPRPFVQSLPRNGRERAIVRAMADLAHDLGLDVVAEGVETETECEAARELGCDLLQGYAVGRPTPAESVPVGNFARAA